MGFVVRDENVTSWFEINTNDGRIRVVRQMDREKAETIRLAIRAEDVAAATTGQTASGLIIIKIPNILRQTKIVLFKNCYNRNADDHRG